MHIERYLRISREIKKELLSFLLNLQTKSTMQRLLVVLLSLAIALVSANDFSANTNVNKRAPGWKGQNLGDDLHVDTEDTGGGKKARRWTGAGQNEVLPGDSHAKGGITASGKRSPITIPLVRRASPHHRPIRGGLLSPMELETNTVVTDVNWLQASRDALIDKYVEGESAKLRLKERRKKRDAQDAVDEEMKKRSAKEKRVVEDIAMTNHNFDTVYSASLLLGTPPKAFSVLLDTGSSYVPSSFFPTRFTQKPTLPQRYLGNRLKLHLHLARLYLLRLWRLVGSFEFIHIFPTRQDLANRIRIWHREWMDGQ